MRRLILATRGSGLALVQANMVKKLLEAQGADVELRIVKTRGDRDQTSPLRHIGGKGLFVREVELALQSGEADLAVHSGKDLPYQLLEGMTIGANPPAADPRDCLITRAGEILPEGAVIGTGSPRRIAECRRLYPQADYREIRGNVDTRLRKLREGGYDAIFLAKAGLDRLQPDLAGLQVRIFEAEEVIPAPCQGILAVECRENDREVLDLLAKIDHEESRQRFEAERSVFCALEADCSVAIGVHAERAEEQMEISVMFQGRRFQGTCSPGETGGLAAQIRKEMLEK